MPIPLHLSRALAFTLSVILLLLSQSATAFTGSNSFGGQDFLPVDEALPFSYVITENGVNLRWDIASEHYLYKERISVEAVAEGVSISELSFSQTGTETEDPYFGTMMVFYEPIEASLSVQLPEGVREATLQVTYQGCAEAGLCYPPQTREVLYYGSDNSGGSVLTTDTGSPSASAQSTSGPSAAQNLETATGLAGFLSEQTLLIIALVFFALGLGLTFTPCVLPMVPIISTLVSSQNTRNSAQALLLAFSYVLGMALTYAAAGVITGSLGASFNLQAHLQSPWVLGIFAGLFALFALSMFNVFDLQLPRVIQDRLNQASQKLSGGRVASVFGIGSLSALIVSPCVSAPLAGSLLYISTTQDALVGGIALFSLGMGMGVPLILVAVGGRKLLPSTGAWMNVVKAFYGVMLLAVAIWLLERLMPAWLGLTLWGLLAAITGVQLGAFDQARAGWQRTWKGLGLVMFAWGLALLAGALGGATDPTRPLTPFMAQAGGGSASPGVQHADFRRFEDPDRIRSELVAASGRNEPVLLDFYADWCISCKVMERRVFSDPDVIARLEPFTLLQIDMTANTREQQALLDELGIFGPPALLFYQADGNEAGGFRVLGEMTRDQFLRHVGQVRESFERIPQLTSN